ncbi:hypothetical protein KAJ61_01615 [Candidatus Parcubacteria bacterium]|nr:hypothetical protein [Candidatus Parcubacteria bacterium]
MFLNKAKKSIKYSDLPARDKNRIIRKSIRDANKEQYELVEQFDKKFGKLKHAN